MVGLEELQCTGAHEGTTDNATGVGDEGRTSVPGDRDKPASVHEGCRRGMMASVRLSGRGHRSATACCAVVPCSALLLTLQSTRRETSIQPSIVEQTAYVEHNYQALCIKDVYAPRPTDNMFDLTGHDCAPRKGRFHS